jgi:hypothetical protein
MRRRARRLARGACFRKRNLRAIQSAGTCRREAGSSKEDTVAKGQQKQNKSNKTKLSTKEKQKKKKEKEAAKKS